MPSITYLFEIKALETKLARLEKAYVVLKEEAETHQSGSGHCYGDGYTMSEAITKAEAILGGKDDA